MIKPDRVVSTTCPYCGVGCNLQLHVKDDYIFKVTSPFDSVVNQGNLCVKGRFGYDYIYHPQTSDHTLVRQIFARRKARNRTRPRLLDRGQNTTADSEFPILGLD